MSRIVLCATAATLVAAFAVPSTSLAQISTGNRANGFNYQPTPGEVVSREKTAGVRPSATSQKETNKSLEEIDRELLRKEGLSTQSVPRITPR